MSKLRRLTASIRTGNVDPRLRRWFVSEASVAGHTDASSPRGAHTDDGSGNGGAAGGGGSGGGGLDSDDTTTSISSPTQDGAGDSSSVLSRLLAELSWSTYDAKARGAAVDVLTSVCRHSSGSQVALTVAAAVPLPLLCNEATFAPLLNELAARGCVSVVFMFVATLLHLPTAHQPQAERMRAMVCAWHDNQPPGAHACLWAAVARFLCEPKAAMATMLQRAESGADEGASPTRAPGQQEAFPVAPLCRLALHVLDQGHRMLLRTSASNSHPLVAVFTALLQQLESRAVDALGADAAQAPSVLLTLASLVTLLWPMCWPSAIAGAALVPQRQRMSRIVSSLVRLGDADDSNGAVAAASAWQGVLQRWYESDPLGVLDAAPHWDLSPSCLQRVCAGLPLHPRLLGAGADVSTLRMLHVPPARTVDEQASPRGNARVGSRNAGAEGKSSLANVMATLLDVDADLAALGARPEATTTGVMCRASSDTHSLEELRLLVSTLQHEFVMEKAFHTQCQQRLYVATQSLATQERRCTALTESGQRLAEQNKVIEQSVSHAEASNRTLQLQVEKLQQEHLASVQRAAQLVEVKEATNEKLCAQLAQAQSQLSMALASGGQGGEGDVGGVTAGFLEQRISVLQAEKDHMQRELDNSRRASRSLATLQAEALAFEHKHVHEQMLARDAEQLREALHTRDADIAGYQRQIEFLNERVQGLEREISTLSSKFAQLSKEKVDVEAKMAQQRDLLTHTSQVSERKIAAVEGKYRALKSLHVGLESIVLHLKSTTDTSKA